MFQWLGESLIQINTEIKSQKRANGLQMKRNSIKI